MELDCQKAAAIFKALGDENRIHILQLLQSGEKCACRLLEELPVSQPTLSHHMKILCDCGIVSGRKEGKWMHYSISKEGGTYALQYLETLIALPETSESKMPCCNS